AQMPEQLSGCRCLPSRTHSKRQRLFQTARNEYRAGRRDSARRTPAPDCRPVLTSARATRKRSLDHIHAFETRTSPAFPTPARYWRRARQDSEMRPVPLCNDLVHRRSLRYSTTLPSSWAGASKPSCNDRVLRATDLPGELHPRALLPGQTRHWTPRRSFELVVYLVTWAAPARASSLPRPPGLPRR